MAGRPKQNLEWNGFVGVTEREKELLEILESWNHKINKANARNIAKRMNTSLEQTAYILRKLIEKGLLDRTIGCSYCVGFNRPKEVELQEGMTIRTIINRELYNQLITKAEVKEISFRVAIEEVLTKGFKKQEEEIHERITRK